MKLEVLINQVVENDGDLNVTVQGWAESDPAGTYPRPIGTINVPSNVRNRRAYYIGRRIIIDVRPS